MTDPWKGKFPSLEEFIHMGDAQKIALTDQAEATIREKIPEAADAVAKAGELAASIMELVPRHPEAAAVVVESIREVMTLMEVMIKKQLEG